MANNSGDMLMKLVAAGGKALQAESQAVLNTSADSLLKGFLPGYFFEVQDFVIGFGLQDDDSASDPGAQMAALLQAHGAATSATGGGKPPKASKPRFGKWVNGDSSTTYPSTLDQVSFSKLFDATSPAMFEMCGESKAFDSATMVRRRSGGGDTTGKVPTLMTFLRIDFTNVLITDVDWDIGDDGIKEKCKFVCRAVKVQYARQRADGTHMGAITGDWPK